MDGPAPGGSSGPGPQGLDRGNDANFAVFAPDETLVVDPNVLYHKNAVTPYAGRTLTGRVRSTWLRGTDISAYVETNGDRRGRLLRRGAAVS